MTGVMKIRAATRVAACVVLIGLMPACGDSQSVTARAAAPQDTTQGSTSPEPAAEIACSTVLASNADLVNVAFPDESAKYWFIQLPYVPNTRFRLEGRYPNARYFSYNSYDAQLRQVDSLADFQLDPAEGSVNPFRTPSQTPGDRWGGDYVMYLVPSEVPEPRPANHMYSASTTLILAGPQPNPQLSLLYRVYVASDGDTGEVGLPRIVMETASGDQAIVGLEPCSVIPDLPLSLGLNEAIADADFPLDWPALPLPPPSARFKPVFRKFYSLPDTLTRNTPLHDILPPDTSGGFLGNRDNAYVGVRYFRDQGDSYIVRAKAPTWAGDPRLGGTAPQLRYWSFCTNEFASQRFVACARDDQTALDSQGYFTFVVSDPADRPSNALATNGITWLPWGGLYPDSSAIYRHMLPATHFDQSIQAIPFGTDEAEVMQAYFPETVYCSKAVMEAAGNSARAIFEACQSAYVAPTPITGVLP